MRVETLQPTCVYVALSPIHTHSHLMDDWQWAVRSDIQLQVLALPPFSIHDFTLFLVRLHFGAAALHRRLFLDCCPLQWAASAAALTSCASESHISFPPTVAESVCLFMMKNGFVTMNTSAFSTLLLQGLVFGSILTTQKNPLTVKVGISATLLILH